VERGYRALSGPYADMYITSRRMSVRKWTMSSRLCVCVNCHDMLLHTNINNLQVRRHSVVPFDARAAPFGVLPSLPDVCAAPFCFPSRSAPSPLFTYYSPCPCRPSSLPMAWAQWLCKGLHQVSVLVRRGAGHRCFVLLFVFVWL